MPINMEQGIITFIKGVNTDLDTSFLNQGMYRDSVNFRLGNQVSDNNAVGDTSGNIGSLENVLGNQLISYPSLSGNRQIVEIASIRNTMIIFANDTVANRGSIYKLILNADETAHTDFELIYEDPITSPLSQRLNFTENVSIVTKYENEDVQKVYWACEGCPIRMLNIKGPESQKFQPASYFDIVKSSLPVSPEIIDILEGGEHKAGKIQYFYTQFNKYETETNYSPVSGMISLTSSSIQGSSSSYKGSHVDENVNKSVLVSIPLLDTTYEYVRLYSVFYSRYNQLPEIRVVTEQKRTGTSMSIIDTGRVLDTVSPEQLDAQGKSIFNATSIETKDNILFAADIEETNFDIDFDARAYAFNSQTIARIYDNTSGEGNSGYIQIQNNNTWQRYFANGNMRAPVPGENYTNWNIPENENCINYSNKRGIDFHTKRYYSPGTQTWNHYPDYYAFQKDGSTFGGEGRSVKYEFIFDSSNTIHDLSDESFFTEYVPEKESLLKILKFPGYKRREVYRFGIVFFNRKQVASPVKWIADIKVPDVVNHYMITNNELKSRIPYIKFDIDLSNLSQENKNAISGFQIVRVKREERDRGVLVSGLSGRLGNIYGASRGYDDVLQPADGNVDFSKKTGGVLSPEILIGKVRLENHSDIQALNTCSIPCVFSSENNYHHDAFKYYRYNGYNGEFALIGIGGSAVVPTLFPGIPADITQDSIISLGAFVNKNANKLLQLDAYKDINDIKTAEYPAEREREKISIGTTGADQYTLTARARTSHGNQTYFNTSSAFYSSTVAGYLLEGSGFNLTISDKNLLFVEFIRDVFISQYGGPTKEARQVNYYIPASDFIQYSENTDQYSTESKYGDTYITMFNPMTCMWDGEGSGSESGGANWSRVRQVMTSFPVESTINCLLLNEKAIHHMSNRNLWVWRAQELQRAGIQELKETGISKFPTLYPDNLQDLYNYNTVYSQDIDSPKYYKDPAITLFQDRNDVKIQASDKKLNGELIDSWGTFRVNNFIEVDSKYGPVIHMRYFNNRLLYWQPKAFGILAVNDRSLISDNNPGELVLGTGGVLDRYEYISDSVGMSHAFNIAVGESAIYWYDFVNKQLIEFSDRLRYLDTELNIKSLVKSKKVPFSDNVVVSVDKDYREVLFSFTDLANTLTETTLVYSQLNRSFIGHRTIRPYKYFKTSSGTLISSPRLNRKNLYKHNSLDINRGNFYGITNRSSISLVFNERYDSIKVYDSLSFPSISITNEGINSSSDTFDKIRINTSYQDTGEYNIIKINKNSSIDNLTVDQLPIIRRERNWTLQIPRNASITSEIMNTVIPDAYIDKTQKFKERLRDNYIIINLSYNNTSGNSFSIPYVKISYRHSTR